MIVILRPDATEEQLQHIVSKAEKLGLRVNISRGVERTVLGFIGPEDVLRVTPLEVFPGVDQVLPVLAPYRLVSREFQKADSAFALNDTVSVGDQKIVVMAGPCSVESFDALLTVAKMVKAAGASVLRGGAFKPRTSPYDFQGLGEEGLRYLKDVGAQTGLATVTEVIDPRHVDMVARYVDVLQIGARNMQNYPLLQEVGMIDKPVFLKRGMSATVKDLLMSAEYVAAKGNLKIMLCERGIRTFETATRNTFDINAIPVIKQLSHLPVIADPSHGTGRWGLVSRVALAAVAAGCDGLMIEVHPVPEEALSDGAQSLTPDNFASLMKQVQDVARAVGRKV